MVKKKVAVLGGGIGALSAAFELTELDSSGEMFDITVYTLGWRLGGKGAVGRRDAHWGYRAEEHGLHVWTGFYDNSFFLVDRCYDALQRLGYAVPFGSRDAAFCALDRCTLMEEFGGDWHPWSFDLPPRAGKPGEFDEDEFVTLVDYLQSLIGASVSYIQNADLPAEFHDVHDASAAMSARRLARAFEDVQLEADTLPDDPKDISAAQSEILQKRLRTALDALREYQRDIVGRDDLRHAFILIELAFTIALGMLADGVMWYGFDHIDEFEWSDWMRSHLCSDDALNSAVVRGCYDYVFGYLRGNQNVGAGTGTRVLLKLMFGYKGSFFYVMKATMGELIFAPLFRLLRARGVTFEFFHRVDSLVLSADATFIERIEVGVQATTIGNVPYCPLISIPNGPGIALDTWPTHPKYELLNEDHALAPYDLESAWTEWRDVDHKSLRVGSEFDVIVLGISIGALDRICAELVEHLPAWKSMVGAIRTTPTMALQLWTTKTTEELGWKGGDETILSGFARPLDSWGDLSLMLPTETWTTAPPRGLAYFVGSFPETKSPPPPAPDPDYPKRQLEYARALAREWVQTRLGALWPNLVTTAGLQWDLFFDPEGRCGEARLAAQYLRVNINPSDRYVLSVAGSVTNRIRADDSGVGNLYLAGDWVRTGLNAGCVEASVMAGRAAAGAIRGVKISMPNATDFEDFNFPMAILPGLQVLREVASRSAGGVGDMSAFCVIVDVPIDAVKSMLPVGMKLHGAKSAKTHEVVLVFAHQRNVRPGILPFGGTNYCEIFNIVPDIELENVPYLRQVRFCFMPYLLLDQLPPVVIGQTMYGFNKQLARIRSDNDSFEVRGPIARVGGHFNREGSPGDIARFPDIFAIRRTLEQPLVGLATDGSYICSIVDMHLDTATCQHATGTVQVGRPFSESPVSLTVNKAPGHGPWGFHLRNQWSLSLPVPVPARKGHASAFDARSLVSGYSQSMFGRFPFTRSK
ncbi:NAD(P)-binding protein [Bradyrhizobium monzae]|uniref:NAD(P)-binding protein n=1 Tax=Bradyrhizobium sp. Oc8 TaxID=2876780 RepID=UPI001F291FE0|nr:NAD(P)-binding protein [Bradyrhizobium sp. Oc8]